MEKIACGSLPGAVDENLLCHFKSPSWGRRAEQRKLPGSTANTRRLTPLGSPVNPQTKN
jgi:hypothetical protein